MEMKKLSVSFDAEISSAQKTVTTAGTREQLATGRPEAMRVKSVCIKALTTNTGKVYVGGPDVSSSAGIDLDPGDSITYEVEAREWENGVVINMSKIWLDVDTDGEGVNYTFVRE